MSLILVSSLLMGGLLFAGQMALGDSLLDGSLWFRLTAILGMVSVSAVVYFGLVILTGAIPRQELMRILKRRRGSTSGT